VIRIRAHPTSRRPTDGGTVAIEFALAGPLFLVLLLGMVELGFGIYQAMQVQDAAEAGVLYAAKHGFNSAGISAAIVNATGTSGITASPAPALFCGCPLTTGVDVISCASTCPSGDAPGQYVQINASISHQTILSYPGLPLPATLTGQSTVRVN
jgi:hypothetical protein